MALSRKQLVNDLTSEIMYIISDIYQIDILETDCFRYIQVAIDNTLGDIVEFFNDDYVDLEVCDDAD